MLAFLLHWDLLSLLWNLFGTGFLITDIVCLEKTRIIFFKADIVHFLVFLKADIVYLEKNCIIFMVFFKAGIEYFLVFLKAGIVYLEKIYLILTDILYFEETYTFDLLWCFSMQILLESFLFLTRIHYFCICLKQ